MKEVIRKRWKDSKPGFNLAATIPVALPIREFDLSALMFATSDYPLSNEFVLRCVEQGFSKASAIAGFLGVDEDIVSGAIAEELSRQNLALGQNGHLELTRLGESTLVGLKQYQLKTDQLTIQIDQLTKKLVQYAPVGSMRELPELAAHLISQDDKITGIIYEKIPRPTKEFFDLHELNAVINNSRMNVIEVKGITGKSRERFKFAYLLVFSDYSGSEVRCELLLDGSISDDHQFAINVPGFLEKMGINIDPPEETPSLIEVLKDLNISDSESLDHLVKIARDIPEEAEDSSIELNLVEMNPAMLNIPKVGIGKFQGLDSAPSFVSVFEHADLLLDALQFAAQRLVIVSPWIRSTVVNKAFIRRVTRLLERGVKVTIAFGYEDGQGNDASAVADLCELAQKFELNFLRHKNTHAKILLVDDCVVTTSFNWLSFRGDSSRTYRMEEGVHYKSKEFADEMLERLTVEFAMEAVEACK